MDLLTGIEVVTAAILDTMFLAFHAFGVFVSYVLTKQLFKQMRTIKQEKEKRGHAQQYQKIN